MEGTVENVFMDGIDFDIDDIRENETIICESVGERLEGAECQSNDLLEASQSSFSKEKRKFHDYNGEIGYIKGGSFVSMTNFSVICTGYVTRDVNATTAEGFLVDVIPKDSVRSSETEQTGTQETAEKRESYYLTWKDMSTQMGILNVISSTKLWTAPSKEQYLPIYFKAICDEYATSADAHRIFPVKGLGLQKASGTPTWVFGSNFQVELRDGKARRLLTSESPFCAIGSADTSLPFYEIEGSLDAGEALRQMIAVENEFMGDNFVSSLLVLGGLGLAVHFEQLSDRFDGVPLIMAYGTPVSGKSTAVEAAMAVIGQSERIGECTLAGAMEMICRQSIPYWWDDADNFTILEKLAVAAYNKSNKKTAKTKSGCTSPRTVPVITMNPTTLSKSVKNDKGKLLRTFSRVVVIPFNKLKRGRHTLANSLDLQTHLKAILPNLLKSVGVIIELGDDFARSRDDSLFQEVVHTIEEAVELDMRTQCNYALLLYSTAKIIEKIGLKEELFPKLKEWMVKVVLPNHENVIGAHQNKVEGTANLAQDTRITTMQKLIVELVEKVIANPKEGKEFFNPSFSARKCYCGQVFGFNVPKALMFIRGSNDAGNALRSYVREQSIGCNGVKLNCGKNQFVGTHIKVEALPDELRIALYKAFEVPCKVHSEYPAKVRPDEVRPKVTNSAEVPSKMLSETQVSSDVRSKIPSGFPCEIPSNVPDEKLSEINLEVPSKVGVLSKNVSEIRSTEIPSEVPSEVLSALTSGLNADTSNHIEGMVEDEETEEENTVATTQVSMIGATAPQPSGKTVALTDKDPRESTTKKERKTRNLAKKLDDDLTKYFKPATERSAKRRKLPKKD